jgi:hypothetical protein
MTYLLLFFTKKGFSNDSEFQDNQLKLEVKIWLVGFV